MLLSDSPLGITSITASLNWSYTASGHYLFSPETEISHEEGNISVEAVYTRRSVADLIERSGFCNRDFPAIQDELAPGEFILYTACCCRCQTLIYLKPFTELLSAGTVTGFNAIIDGGDPEDYEHIDYEYSAWALPQFAFSMVQCRRGWPNYEIVTGDEVEAGVEMTVSGDDDPPRNAVQRITAAPGDMVSGGVVLRWIDPDEVVFDFSAGISGGRLGTSVVTGLIDGDDFRITSVNNGVQIEFRGRYAAQPVALITIESQSVQEFTFGEAPKSYSQVTCSSVSLSDDEGETFLASRAVPNPNNEYTGSITQETGVECPEGPEMNITDTATFNDFTDLLHLQHFESESTLTLSFG